MVVGPGERVSVELLVAAAVPVIESVQVHADVLYEPRVGGGVGVRRRRHVAHAALVGRRSVADQPLLVGAQRQRRVEPAVVALVANRHDARRAAVDEHHVGRTPSGEDTQPSISTT